MSLLLWPILALVLAVVAVVLLASRRVELRARDARIAARVDWDAPDPDEDVPPAFRGIL